MLANAVLLASDRNLTDDIIISRVLLGKTEEYEILVRRYNSLLYKTARGILKDEGDIEDAMQEAYLRGFEKLYQFRNEARFSTWLTRILINCAFQQVGKLKGREYLRVDELPLNEMDELQENPQTADPEVGDNLKKALEGAIGHLPPKYRVVFVLREIEQKPVAEVASLLDITEENVKVRLHRAKSMLKDLLRTELKSLDIFELHATRCAIIAGRVMDQIRVRDLTTRWR